jgi:dolichol-phosphate mannosyltransferase
MRTAVIIIPTYNEAGNIKSLLDQIFEVSKSITRWDVHVMVIDSNSPDKTAELVKKLQNTYPKLHMEQTPKEGLGKAYVYGFTKALEKLNPYVLFEMDADLSHDPKEIPHFLEKIEKGADFVVGSRYIRGGSIPSNWGLHRKIFSVCGNLIVRFGFMRLNVTDWTNGFRAIKSWAVKASISHIKNYSGYVFQIAFLDYAYNQKAVIQETPINFVDRTAGVSKINSFQYISQMLFYVFSHSAFIKFVITGFLGFGVDFAFAYMLINFLHIAKANANMMSAEVAIISNFFINNFWSFKDKMITGGVFGYLKKFILFNLVSSGSIIIQGVGLTLLLNTIGDTLIPLGVISLSSWVVYKILIIAFIIIPYSYILYNKVIWKHKS